MSKLKLYKVTIYGPNPTSMNHVARVSVIMLDVTRDAVALHAKRQMGYSVGAPTEVEELTGPFDSGYLISYRILTDEPLPVSAPNVINAPKVLNEFDELFTDEAMSEWVDDD